MTWKRLGPQIVGQNIGSEVIVADVQSSAFHSISGSGTLMWQAIDRGYSKEEILELLIGVFDSPLETLDKSLTQLIDELVCNDLIKPNDELCQRQEIPHEMLPSHKQPFVPFAFHTFDGADSQLTKKVRQIKWRPAGSVVANCLNGAVVLSDPKQGISCMITGAGNLIWEKIGSGANVQEVISQMPSWYDAAPELIENEAYEFVNKLAIAGLITPQDERTSGAQSDEAAQIEVRNKKETWVSPAMTISSDRNDAIKRITRLNGWQAASPRIVAESIDDEVIAVDLMAGIYHSITGSGLLIWEGIDRGYVHDELVQYLQSRFEVTTEQADSEVDDFVSQLVQHDLILPRKEKAENQTALKSEKLAGKPPFEKPKMVVYRDMEDMLKLDPVHDFDEFGWPSKV